MPIPATITACDLYQGYGCCSKLTSKNRAKFNGCLQIIFYMVLTYMTYANIVAVCCSSGRLRETSALFVLLSINGLMFLFGVFFGIIFLRGASNGDMNDLKRYRIFALFSILVHLNALFAFVILEVWMLVVISASCLVMNAVGLRFVADIDKEIKLIGKILQQLRSNQQGELPGAPPPYSTLLV